MGAKSHLLRLEHMVEAIGHIRTMTAENNLAAFEKDWRTRWALERALEIISEASRHLPEELKRRHPGVPWQKVAGIGNVLRHEYQDIAPAILWKIACDDLVQLETVCREELDPGEAG